MQLHQYENRLKELDIRVKVFTFDTRERAQDYRVSRNVSWPLVLDAEKVLYEAYRLQKSSWIGLYNPRSIGRYLAIMFRGVMPGKPGKNLAQLGGDVLIDPDGVIRVHHVCKSPHDRPSIESVLAIVEKFH